MYPKIHIHLERKVREREEREDLCEMWGRIWLFIGKIFGCSLAKLIKGGGGEVVAKYIGGGEVVARYIKISLIFLFDSIFHTKAFRYILTIQNIV